MAEPPHRSKIRDPSTGHASTPKIYFKAYINNIDAIIPLTLTLLTAAD